MIKILIVDDSPTETELLKALFNAEKDLEVVACAKNGKEGIEMALKYKPDIITMDIVMPIMGGLEAIRKIMATNPIPIVVISSRLNDIELNTTFKALEAGALSVLEKPGNINSVDFKKSYRYTVDTLRSMAEIKVIKRKLFVKENSELNKIKNQNLTPLKRFELIAIGTSVGGPQALKIILSKLPADFPLPIAIVQHMTLGFINGFATWLNDNTPLKVKIAANKEILEKGTVYLAPDHFHLKIEREISGNLLTRLVKQSPVSGFCPSVTVLLQSVAKVCGKNAIGMLLTGMGDDGAQGLLELKKQNSHTIIQDKASTIVFGMGNVALSLGAVDKIIQLNEISNYLIGITQQRS